MVSLEKINLMDFKGFYKMYKTYQLELQTAANSTWEITPLKKYLEYAVKGAQYNKFTYYIEKDGKIVGFVAYQFDQYDNVIYIEDMYVKPEYRNKKIGLSAIELINNQANKYTKIFLYVLKGNSTGKAFWSKVAYKLHWVSINDSTLTVFTADGTEMKGDLLKLSFVKSY